MLRLLLPIKNHHGAIQSMHNIKMDNGNIASPDKSVQRRSNYSGGFSEYINVKEEKLRNQFEASISKISSQIFKNVCIHVNGLTKPPLSVLRSLILEHGGSFEQYFHRDRVTHFICTHVAKAKLENFIKRSHGKIKVMKPEWITDSIKAGKLLDEFKYRNYLLTDEDSRNQINIHEFFDKSKMVEDVDEKEIALIVDSDTKKESNESLDHHLEVFSDTDDGIELLAGLIESDEEINDDSESDTNVPYNDPMTTNVPFDSSISKTSADPNFLNDYYKNSRLHHLSTWREELKTFAASLMKNKKQAAPKNSLKDSETVVMHVDLDCFFVSASLLSHPDREALKGLPIAVTHAKNDNYNVLDSSADISSCNYEARAYGIRNDMYINEALKLCPQLQMIPYDFEGYNRASRVFYEVLSEWASEFQAVSCDEAFIELDTSRESNPEVAAQLLRAEIKEKCEIDASIGIGPNMLIARLATRKAKPNGQFRVKKDDLDEFMQIQMLKDLPGVGDAIIEKLPSNVSTCQDVRKLLTLTDLQNRLGNRQGLNLFRKARGEDDRSVGVQLDRKSVGSEISWGVRFSSLSQCRRFLDDLGNEVWQRMLDAFPSIPEPKPKRIQVKLYRKQEGAGASMKHLGRGICDTFHRSKSFPKGILTESSFVLEIWQIFEAEFLKGLSTKIEDVRGIGIFASDFACNQKSSHKDILESFKPANCLAESALISASQVDSQVWPELPEEIRREFEEEWQKRAATKAMFSSNTEPAPKNPKASLHPKKNSMKSLAASKTLTQIWGQRDKREANELLKDIAKLPTDQFDHQVILALPRELQLEIVNQWKLDTKRRIETRPCDTNLVPRREDVPVDPESIIKIVEQLPIEFRGRSDWTCEQIYAVILNNKDRVDSEFVDEIDSLLTNLVLHECLKPVSDSCSILKENSAFGTILEKLKRLALDLFNSNLKY